MNRLNKAPIVITLFISIILVNASIFLPSKISTPEQLPRVGFGYPFHFIFQDYSTLDPVAAVNYPLRLSNPLEHPLSNASISNYLLSGVIIWAIVFLLYTILNKIFIKQ